MDICEYCGHNDSVCQSVKPFTEDQLSREMYFHVNNRSDVEVRSFRDIIRKSMVAHPDETLKEIIRIIEESKNPSIVYTTIDSLGYYHADEIGTAEWRTKVIELGLKHEHLEARDNTMQLIEHWDPEGIEILQKHVETVKYLSEYQHEILKSAARAKKNVIS